MVFENIWVWSSNILSKSELQLFQNSVFQASQPNIAEPLDLVWGIAKIVGLEQTWRHDIVVTTTA